MRTLELATRGQQLAVALLTLICLTGPAGCSGPVPSNEFAPPPPPEVRVATPLQQTVTIYQEETGTTESVGTAEIRSRVNGYVEEINFAPGQIVDKDEVLYVIEKDEYQTAVDAAAAEVSTAEAAIETMEAKVGEAQVELKRSQLEFERVTKLRDQNVVTQADYEVAEAARDSAQALVKSAEANVSAAKADLKRANAKLDQAKLDLTYTDVTAPISGRITKTDVKVGNLVDPGTLLATIVNADDIYVNFSLSDRDAMRLQQAAMEQGKDDRQPAASDSENGGDRAPNYIHRKAYLRREIDKKFRFEGQLNYVDEKGVDPQTGTLAVRAKFANPNHIIFPGLFVYIRVPVATINDALLVPDQLVSRDQGGTYVLVVNSDNEVERKSITTGESYPEYKLVTSGLEPDDRIIVSGSQRLRPDMKVVPESITLPPADLGLAVDTPAEQETAPDEQETTPDAADTAPASDETSR